MTAALMGDPNHTFYFSAPPSTIQDRAVRRACVFLRGADDEMMAVTLSLWQPEMRWTRITLQGFLAARDAAGSA
ncbi:MAG: hypothetical protein AB9869_05020 [Verrucomicrobiia bacterium]